MQNNQQKDVSTKKILPQIQNIVATVNLQCTIDLKDVATRTRNSEYNPKRFSAVIMRIRDPKTTALIFSTGKMVVTGAKSEEASLRGARRFAKIIKRLDFDVNFSEFKIQNIVSSCGVDFPIRLEGLALAHKHYSSYEPEIFPGLIYRMVEPKLVLTIFVSGKIVITGAKSRSDINTALDNIMPTLITHQKETLIGVN